MNCKHCTKDATKKRDGDNYCDEHYWASFFLYVPSGGRKLPLRGWKWSSDAPDDVDPRSEENPYTFTYEQTLGDAKDEISDRVPDWDNTWIRVGVIDGYDWVDFDIDTDEDGHDKVIDDPDKIGFEDDKVGVMATSGGAHLEVVVKDTVESFGAESITGVDYQGTVKTVGLGVAGDPFHNSDGYEFKNAGEPVEKLYDLTEHPAAISYDGEAVFRPVREHEGSDSGYESTSVSCDHPVSAEQVVPGFSAGDQGAHPIHGSGTGNNFGVDDDGDTWVCWSGRHDLPAGKHNVTGSAYHYIAMEEGILECGEWMASDEAYAGKQEEIAEACRRRGVPLPLHLEQGEQKPAVIAPYTPINRADPTVNQIPDMDLGDVRRQTRNIVSEALKTRTDSVIRIPPGGGKSYSMIKELVAQRVPANYVAGTHRNDNEACELMEEEGFTDYDLAPSASRTGLDQDGNDLEYLNDTHCPTYMGEHGEAEQTRMKELVDQTDGSTRLVHSIAEDEDSSVEEFACQHDGDCNYVESWSEWDAEAMIQVCHYTHLNMDALDTVGDTDVERVNVVDEFPADSFETSWTGSEDDHRSISALKDDVMSWLSQYGPRSSPSGATVWDALDSDDAQRQDLDGLREAQTLEDLKGSYMPWDEVNMRDIEGAIDNGWHPAISLVAYLYAKSQRLEDGWRWAKAGKFTLAVEPNGDIHLMRPPKMSGPVIGLDATACEPMWRTVTGRDDIRAIDSMTTKQKMAYYKNALNIDVVQISDWMKSMAAVDSDGNGSFKPDHAEMFIDYLEHAANGEDVGMISSRAALSQMRIEEVGLDRVDMSGYYGNFKGENRFGDINVGGVFGSNHPGDRVIEKWAAYRGESAEREEAPDGDRSDWELNYQNETADKVFDYYLEGAVMQAIVRFSRNEERGLVVVYTDRIPDEVPVHKGGITSYADSRHDVLEAVEDGAATLKEVHEGVIWSERTCRRAISELEDAGALKTGPDGSYTANGPVSRVGRIDGNPIILYRDVVDRTDEVSPSDPTEPELLGVRALLMDVVDEDSAFDGSVQASIPLADD